MADKRLYVFWSNAHQAYHVKGSHSYSVKVEDAARLTEGAALDAMVAFASVRDPREGYVLILAPECRA